MPFVRAGPAEILRAAQKDDTVIRHLQNLIAKVELSPLLRELWTSMPYKNSAKCLGQFLFYVMTTLGGLQTLGEEYTGILQVDSSLQRLPSKLVLVRFWLKDRQSINLFRLLGLVSSLQLLTLLLEQRSNRLQFKRKEHIQSSPYPRMCVICADDITSPTVTPCGHIFCWYCIIEWTQNEQNCPICRRTVAPNRVVPMMNRIHRLN